MKYILLFSNYSDSSFDNFKQSQTIPNVTLVLDATGNGGEEELWYICKPWMWK